jgi:uncharacterized protein YjbJ (UPF0337 family)
MNRDTVEGKFDQLKGKAKQSVGEAVGNNKLANSGAIDQVKGAGKEAWGNAKDAAADDADARSQSHAHDVRERMTSTAQNMKDVVNEKATDIKERQRRSA